MLRYLSEQVKAGLEPFGIGIILAQKKSVEQNYGKP